MSDPCPMLVCYGCEYPMNYAFETVDEGGSKIPYCLHCYIWRRLKGVGPDDHEPGTVSNGSSTMRSRGKAEWGGAHA